MSRRPQSSSTPRQSPAAEAAAAEQRREASNKPMSQKRVAAKKKFRVVQVMKSRQDPLKMGIKKLCKITPQKKAGNNNESKHGTTTGCSKIK